ncbi:tyrosine-type recombinase/integrase [Acetobacter sacchari]|uniref:Tyrosine-type recombinase/integrase n=1 Tax=Acetobacter sacchari TaxID=2661687 RepID=A0ABS3M1A2_9PROT|nr:site-specific integrase [Acetobacter sacchari]MBO1361923.1 tyrosine-type recombinase/integrase [Acetobacter sacchari]
MSRLAPNRLTARQVATLKDGALADGGSLWVVAKGGSKVWSFRYTSPKTGKRREMGLGSAFDVSLQEARRRATECRQALLDDLDPLEARREEERAAKREAGVTFREAAERYITEQTPAWRDRKGPSIWLGSLRLNVFPGIGDRAVNTIDTEDVLSVLRPIWNEKTETASRVRGRIEHILDYARTHGWREGENPARWKGHLAAILPAPSKVAKVEHHAATDRKDIARVMAALAASGGIAAKAVRFTCFTAARSGEIRSATWDEIDLDTRVWTVPAHKMKAGREHRVPLSPQAVEVLQEVLVLRDRRFADLIFPGHKAGRPLSDVALSKALHVASKSRDVTVHGLRSTFRDWAAEDTDYPHEVAEMALAHAVGNKVEAAYRRGDLFEKRRGMMADWAAFACPPSAQ